jgi:hypothetical protein
MAGTINDNTPDNSGDGSQTAFQDTATYIEQDNTALERIASLSWERADSVRRVETRIRYEEPKFNIAFEPLPSDPDARKKSLSELAAFVSLETLNEIEASEQPLLTWLARDSANPSRFFADPLSCLAEAQVGLSPRALNEIRQVRQAQLASVDLNALANIKHLDVRLGSEPARRDDKASERKGCLRGLARTLLKRDG